MSEYWLLNSTMFADLDAGSIIGIQGLGFYRLQFQLKVATRNTPEEQKITVMNLAGELSVAGLDGKQHYLGHVWRQGFNIPLSTSTHVGTHHVTFEIELDTARLEGIERIRLGGDLKFYLNVHGVINSVQWGAQQSNQVILCYPANQSAWIKILEQIDFRKTLLLELQLLPEGNNPVYANAVKHLQNAQTQMLQGHYRNAVSECRDVLESLSTILGDEKEQTPETLKSWFLDAQNMSKEQRIRLMRRAFKVLTNASKHADVNAASIEWGATDARTAINMTASLFQLSTEL
ncbi:MAG: hypothetical protein KJ795_12500 [Gammaproteobacteria bacterium]|nr:hypothetical protein [Gammaproteobacteria bacterium]MBU1777285.1 hypothetical protein [Gammaproteobacteria bacterium]MBU1968833.1 hypothetical protein [Gammaproteobacteria bacterium]